MAAPIALALDGMARDAALALAARVAGRVYALKVHDLFLREGPGVLATLRRHAPVWVDLKCHDIPATVGKEVAALVAHGADFITVHASGGPAMLAEAVKAGGPDRIIAVTALTSLDAAACRDIYGASPADVVRRLGRMAAAAGVRAIVCAPAEATLLRDDPATAACRRLTPGIRPTWAAGADDQARTATPAAALAGGATHLVIGRPIVAAADPLAALDRTLDEIGAPA